MTDGLKRVIKTANYKTYQDLADLGENEQSRIDFVRDCISLHKGSKEYQTAEIANEYDKQRNVTIVNYQKTVNLMGRTVPDRYSPNWKMCSNFYNRLTTQRTQYSLSNGVTWSGVTVTVPEGTPNATRKIIWDDAESGAYHYEWQASVPTGIEEKLGKNFDTQLQKLCKAGIDGGVSFGFFNLDHLEVFKITEFVPLYDEENGSLRAGIRWVQIDKNKPLRATLYEENGYTEYIWHKRVENGNYIEQGMIYRPKRTYKQKIAVSGIDAGTIYNGENYPSFPIIPFFPNEHKQSAIVGMREHIDAYDLHKNGYANELDTALLYWVLTGAAGFEQAEAAQFIQQLKQSAVAVIEADQNIQPVTVNPQVDGRERLLDRIEKDIYKDYNALDIDQIKSGAVTATQIKAAYEALNTAADQFEYQIIEFLNRLMKVVGVEDTPTFTRSMLVNVSETVQILTQAAPYLTEDYTTTKILELLGDGDKAEYILNQKAADEMSRFIPKNETEEAEESEVEENV